MSHAKAVVKFSDGTVLFGEYDGTSDIVCSRLCDSLEEVYLSWRTADNTKCNCGKEEPVSYFTDYGGGFYIDAIACKQCKSVRTEDWEDFRTYSRDEVPDDWAAHDLGW